MHNGELVKMYKFHLLNTKKNVQQN